MLGRLVELRGGLELEVIGAPSQAASDAIASFNPAVSQCERTGMNAGVRAHYRQ